MSVVELRRSISDIDGMSGKTGVDSLRLII